MFKVAFGVGHSKATFEIVHSTFFGNPQGVRKQRKAMEFLHSLFIAVSRQLSKKIFKAWPNELLSIK